MEAKSKAETFIGFAIRARKCRIGMNSAMTLKRANLIIVCNTASDNTKKEAEKLSKKLHCPIIISITKTLVALTHKDNAKVMAIADAMLSKAILDNLEQDFIAIK